MAFVCPLVALSVATVQSFHAVKKWHCMFKEGLMFWCSVVEANRPPNQVMPVARQEDLGLCVLWSLSL